MSFGLRNRRSLVRVQSGALLDRGKALQVAVFKGYPQNSWMRGEFGISVLGDKKPSRRPSHGQARRYGFDYRAGPSRPI